MCIIKVRNKFCNNLDRPELKGIIMAYSRVWNEIFAIYGIRLLFLSNRLKVSLKISGCLP